MSHASLATVKQSTLQHEAKARFSRTVVVLGWVSLLTGAASDTMYPLVPELLRSIGGGALWIGWFEGVAEVVSTA